MREDQLIALQDIQADVCDAFIEECQTKDWPTTDSQQGRGDRYWMKQNASASLKIVAQIESVLAARAARKAGGTPTALGEEEKTDAMIKRVAAEAGKALERAGLKR